jgi:hypothetical protein
MIRELLSDAAVVPETLRHTSADLLHRIQHAQDGLRRRRDDARRWVSARAHAVRTDGEARLFDLQVGAIDQGRKLLERAAEVPALQPVQAPAQRWFAALQSALLAPAMEDYDALAVRDVLKGLYLIDHIGLLRIRRHEAQHKNRKTILDAIQRELEKRERQATNA